MQCWEHRKTVRDIAGARVTCYNIDDVEVIQKAIQDHIDVKHCTILRTQQDIGDDGYIGQHLEVIVSVLYNNRSTKDNCEIQIRTLAQDTWAVLSHKEFYKKVGRAVPPLVKDDMVTLSTLLQCIDRIALNIKRRVQDEERVQLTNRFPQGFAARVLGSSNQIKDESEIRKLVDEQAKTLYRRGNQSYEKGNYKKAAGFYQQCTDLKKDFSEAWFNWALCRYNLRDFEGAIAKYTQAISFDRTNPVTYNNLGDAHYRLREFRLAIRQYDTAIDLDQSYLKAYYNRGLSYACILDYDKAISDFDQVIKLNPGFAEAWHIRGLAFEYNGNQSRALSDYDKSIDLDRSFAEAYVHRGYLRYTLEDKKGAHADIAKAMAINSAFPDAYYYSGLIAYEGKNFVESISLLSKCIDLNYPDLNIAFYKRGWAYYSNNEFKKAMDDFTSAIKTQYPDLWHAYYSRGLAFHSLGIEQNSKDDSLSAIHDFDQTINLNPQYAQAFDARGTAKTNIGDFAGAVADYCKSIEQGSDEVWTVYCNRGSAYIELKRFEDAVKDFNEALALKPGFAAAYLGLGNTCLRLARYQEAIEHFRRGIKVERDKKARADHYSFRGIAYAYLGNENSALRDLTAALRGTKDAQVYNASCIYSVLHRITKKEKYRSKAFKFLKRISTSKNLLKKDAICNDPDWQHLRSDARFISIVGDCSNIV